MVWHSRPSLDDLELEAFLEVDAIVDWLTLISVGAGGVSCCGGDSNSVDAFVAAISNSSRQRDKCKITNEEIAIQIVEK